MRRLKIIKVLILTFLLIVTSSGYAQNASDYLILQSIGNFYNSGKGKCGKGSGPIAAAGHFKEDHSDLNCRTGYYNTPQDIAVSIQLTQHSGSDSDKWLLHEVEDGYRDSDDSDGRLGLLSGAGVKIREIGGSRFIYWGLGGGSYTWVSGQKVVEIKYTDLQRTKPEPIEVVQAYFQKHPSTITLTDTEIKSRAHNEKWLKDEMERRLWLCDKWFYQLQIGKAELKAVLQNAVDSMQVFLDYREKYYGIKALEDKKLLSDYLLQNNGTGIKAKLKEYKDWWSVNKGNPINL